MKLLYFFLEDDYKHIPKGGYQFDNEFIVEEFNPNPVNYIRNIRLKHNTDYHHPFNNSISNITCIVGKNGIGKTTFFELLIASLLWRLDGELLKDKLHFLFYDNSTDNFFIESYINNAHAWQINLDGTSKDIYKNTYTQNKREEDKNTKYNLRNDKFSVLPFQMNLIFHSLSPFDRIYSLLKQRLSSSPEMREHYVKRFKYIGINQVETNDVKYEYMTIINLLNLFFNENSKNLINQFGYFFENIFFNTNSSYVYTNIKFPKYTELIEKNMQLELFGIDENKYSQIIEMINNRYQMFLVSKLDAEFLNMILLKNLKLSEPNDFMVFLHLAILRNDANKNKDILEVVQNALDDLESFIEKNMIFEYVNYAMIKNLVLNKDKYLKLEELKDPSKLEKIIKEQQIYDLLKLLKSLSIMDVIDFSINLRKKDNENKIDFFKLSSGERTLLSYFANIVGRINEIYEIQKQDETYNDVSNKTFLILIDEVELHLHPEWQRMFIKRLNDFFNYGEFPINLQFVIATHSPFVVSDIYDQNIIYLGETGKETKTFGGNIFDIFKDDFYVSNTIGAFSESIIKDLSEFLYFLFVLKKAKSESNFFMLRDFLDLMYADIKNRDSENIELIEKTEKFLSGQAPELITQYDRIVRNKYFANYRNETFFSEARKIIDNIGEEVVRQHINKMYLYLQDSR
ncbi:MAG: AAA family ATPase [Sulfuricurvum sp.]|uniref:AAA family ATPase n=1 Tax=Sulfuricurvum sp. TaxID=2025608 RepID=UPI002622A964|nr:AAA family ATPase [Sulfuricurvum sp.]MDD2829892.1 AAA family ATPase [Sulfuricurvum sp.]MDD4949538.1 AAA family ATPase [Sulfuricurvum sp.]